MIERLRKILQPVGLDITMLVAVFLAVGGVWAFVEIADEVTEGETKSLDEWALRVLRNPQDPSDQIGAEWLEEVGRDVTALGGVAVLTMVTLAVVGFLLIQRKTHAMWLVVVATIGALVISTLLKNAFDRERPDIVPHKSHVQTSSFPSGHSMLSAAVYMTLGALLARFVEGRFSKIYFIGIAMLLTFLVGVSRVYVGVHYPTDVLAGWTAGLVWAILCWFVARYLQRRGAVERDVESADNADPAAGTSTIPQVGANRQ